MTALDVDGRNLPAWAADAGIVVSTLLEDPKRCTGADLIAARDAAASVGVTSFAMWPQHICAMDLVDSDERVAAWRGRVEVLETAMGFTHGPTARFLEDARGHVDLAVALGTRMIATCTLTPTIDDLDAATEGFAALGELAAEEGITVCLEFLPWTAIPDLATAWRVVSRAGLDNVGLVVDTWHWQRQPGGPDFELLSQIPGRRIGYVQICDAAPQPEDDLMAEAMANRRVPGDGVVDFRRLATVLRDIGAEPVYMTEVYNAALARTGAHNMATVVRESVLSISQRSARPLPEPA